MYQGWAGFKELSEGTHVSITRREQGKALRLPHRPVKYQSWQLLTFANANSSVHLYLTLLKQDEEEIQANKQSHRGTHMHKVPYSNMSRHQAKVLHDLDISVRCEMPSPFPREADES